MIHSNYALEYTLDRVLQVNNRLPFAFWSPGLVIPIFTNKKVCITETMLHTQYVLGLYYEKKLGNI